MTGYDKELVNEFKFISSYNIKNNYIYVRFSNDETKAIPYSRYNEEQIINNMKEESYEINNYLLPKIKRDLVFNVATCTTSLFGSIALFPTFTSSMSLSSILVFMMLNGFTVITAIFSKEKYSTLKQCHERGIFLDRRSEYLSDLSKKPILKLVSKNKTNNNDLNHKNYSLQELKEMALNMKEKLLNHDQKNNELTQDCQPKLVVYTNKQMANVKTLKHSKKKK